MKLPKSQVQDIYHKIVEGKVIPRVFLGTDYERKINYVKAYLYLCLNDSEFYMTKQGNLYKLNWSNYRSRYVEFSLEKPDIECKVKND